MSKPNAMATPPEAELTRRRALVESASATVAVMVVTAIVVHLASRTAFAEYTGLAVAVVFLVPAWSLAQRHDPSLERFGLALGGLFGSTTATPAPWRAVFASAVRELAFALSVASVVFPPFAAGFYLWHVALGTELAPFELELPPDAVNFALNQVFVVALPEEAFFRGYLQTRLSDAWTKRRRVLGAELSLAALVAQAFLFALLHVVADLDPLRFSVFFPGLLFGWMRARRDGIGAALAFHALANLFSSTLAESWNGQ